MPGTEPSCGGKLYEEEESLLSLPTSREGDSPQPSAPELLLQERNRAHDWPKVRSGVLAWLNPFSGCIPLDVCLQRQGSCRGSTGDPHLL